MFGKLLAIFRDFGFIAGPLYVFHRVLSQMQSPVQLHCYDLMVQPVAEKAFLPPNFAKGMEVRQIKPGDSALSRMPRTPEVIASHFAQPTVCLGAFAKDELIAYMWLCHGPYQEDEVSCTFVPTPVERSVFDFDFFVFPSHRTGLAFTRLWDATNQYLREKSIHYTFSRVSHFNIQSRRAHDHFGWKRSGCVVFFKSDAFQLMLATIPPYLHLRLGRSLGPQILMSPDVLLASKPQQTT